MRGGGLRRLAQRSAGGRSAVLGPHLCPSGGRSLWSLMSSDLARFAEAGRGVDDEDDEREVVREALRALVR